MFQAHPYASAVCERAVLITGVARSGTTLMGNLVATLQATEYIFEPPYLYALFAYLRGRLPEYWKVMYETYLAEDVLMGLLTGRRLNMNLADDSSIFNILEDGEIWARQASTYRRPDLLSQLPGIRMAYKMPDVLPYLGRLVAAYKDMKVIIMFREPEAVIQSLKEKSWYGDPRSAPDKVQGPWLNLKDGVPFWWREGQSPTSWQEMPELERLAHYWYLQYSSCHTPRNLGNVLFVDYDELIRHPVSEFARVIDYLEASPGAKTEAVVAGIGARDAPPDHVLGLLDEEFRNRILKLIDRTHYRAVDHRRG